MPASASPLIVKEYPELGILKARKTLHDEFLAADYDYIIMLDDDAIIESKDDAHVKYMEEIDKHPQGFCFMPGKNSKYHPYVGAQLNLCAISRSIYEKEQMVDIDPQKEEGYEDSIYSCLLHHKYSKFEFVPPVGIKCVQFLNRKEKAPSTWAEKKHDSHLMLANTDRIQEYIVKHKAFPPNYKSMIEKAKKPPETVADGRKGCFLYF